MACGFKARVQQLHLYMRKGEICKTGTNSEKKEGEVRREEGRKPRVRGDAGRRWGGPKVQRSHLSGSANLTGHVQPPSPRTSPSQACRPDPSLGTRTHQGSEDPGSWEGGEGASSCSHYLPVFNEHISLFSN